MLRCRSFVYHLGEMTCTQLALLHDAARFLVLCLRPAPALAAANLFRRKQLAQYQERQAQPRRANEAIFSDALDQRICNLGLRVRQTPFRTPQASASGRGSSAWCGARSVCPRRSACPLSCLGCSSIGTNWGYRFNAISTALQHLPSLNRCTYSGRA